MCFFGDGCHGSHEHHPDTQISGKLLGPRNDHTGNIPEENLENYADEMLKNEDEIRKATEKILDNKVIDYLKAAVRVDNKQITVEKFNKLFENN